MQFHFRRLYLLIVKRLILIPILRMLINSENSTKDQEDVPSCRLYIVEEGFKSTLEFEGKG